jgi:hypothetical protein
MENLNRGVVSEEDMFSNVDASKSALTESSLDAIIAYLLPDEFVHMFTNSDFQVPIFEF